MSGGSESCIRALAIDGPGDGEAIGEHAEAKGPEGFLKWHVDRSTFCQCVKESFGKRGILRDLGCGTADITKQARRRCRDDTGRRSRSSMLCSRSCSLSSVPFGLMNGDSSAVVRSEERRVGKEC